MAANKKRRPKGSGSQWYDETTGRWFLRTTYKERKITVAGQDPAGAQAKLDAKKKEIDADLDTHGNRQSLKAYMAWYLESIEHDVKPRTLYDYIQRTGYYITPNLGHYRLCDVKPRHILDWSNLLYRNYAHSSAKQAVALLRRALDTAVHMRYIEENPAISINVPRRKRLDEASKNVLQEHGTALTQEQITKLLEATRVYTPVMWWVDAEALFAVAAAMGTRKGEVLGIRLSDLDLDAKQVTIRQQLQAFDRAMHIGTTKNDTIRVLPLNDHLVSLLRTYLQRRRERQLKAGARWAGSDFLFVTPLGKPIRPYNLVKHFKDCLKLAGLPSIRFHDLRKTAISHMRDIGIDAEVIAAIAGHTHVSVTLDIYTRVGQARMREAIERLQKSA